MSKRPDLSQYCQSHDVPWDIPALYVLSYVTPGSSILRYFSMRSVRVFNSLCGVLSKSCFEIQLRNNVIIWVGTDYS